MSVDQVLTFQFHFAGVILNIIVFLLAPDWRRNTTKRNDFGRISTGGWFLRLNRHNWILLATTSWSTFPWVTLRERYGGSALDFCCCVARSCFPNLCSKLILNILGNFSLSFLVGVEQERGWFLLRPIDVKFPALVHGS